MRFGVAKFESGFQGFGGPANIFGVDGVNEFLADEEKRFVALVVRFSDLRIDLGRGASFFIAFQER